MNKILDFLKNIKLPKLGKRSIPGIIFWGVVLALSVGLFIFTRGLTTCWRLTSLPGMLPASCGVPSDSNGSAFDPNPSASGTSLPPTPEPPAPEVDYPKWDGASRINIVFFGLRGGDPAKEDCPLCTDTIIIFSVDPTTKTASMLSVPRDMYVNIPGFGYSRINTAWTSGEGARLPGGGPGLAMKTVSQFIGVPIQYYVNVDFNTFVAFINMIGGIDVYNNENLLLDPLGNGKDKVRLTCCGMRHLIGRVALAYARCRDESQGCTDGDVGRAKRQQKVILAIRDKVFSPEYFPKLMAQAPELYNLFSGGIHTNMSLEDAIKLAALAKDIPLGSIKPGVIDNSMTTFDNVILGGQNASILKPIPDKIRVLRDELFTTGGATSPIAQGDPRALMQADGARVSILNGTFTAQLDARTGNYLLQQGVTVTGIGQAPQGYAQTTI
ncbi:MAG: LCP family protein, partial [Chloroflexi bacterium]|nr:LCP family protein [Chloroflexota bacterium]